MYCRFAKVIILWPNFGAEIDVGIAKMIDIGIRLDWVAFVFRVAAEQNCWDYEESIFGIETAVMCLTAGWIEVVRFAAIGAFFVFIEEKLVQIGFLLFEQLIKIQWNTTVLISVNFLSFMIFDGEKKNC